MGPAIGKLFLLLVLVLLSIDAIESRPDSAKRGKLSNIPHEGEDGEHNAKYDHEAFLGKEEAEEFEKLSPEESKKRLRLIVKKIDVDGDGVVVDSELRGWIDRVHKRYTDKDVDQHWKERETTGDDKITWDEYIMATYKDEEATLRNRTDYNFNRLFDNDRRRWLGADVDGDGALTREEYRFYLFPHEGEHMRGVVGEETLEDMDKDKDGFISMDEFLRDLLSDEDREAMARGEEPDWMQAQRDDFTETRDKDKDGKLSKEEVGEWVMPIGYDAIESEAAHLMHHADKDEDKKLTEQEIVDKYDLFVGSQATQYGEVLNRHDEF